MDIKDKLKNNILIISRGFKSGDAITTLNLFSQWPKEHLYCASLIESEYARGVADFYYLGAREVKYSFPYNLLFRPCPSHRGVASRAVKHKKGSIIRSIYQKLLRPVMQWLDIYETRLSINISKEFEDWIKDVKPDAIYTSLGDIPTSKFVLEIHKKFPDLKIIVHGFDDWLSPSYRIINETIHRKKAEKLLKDVLYVSSGFFSSSEKMAFEYKSRYGQEFTFFTNPANIIKSDLKKSKGSTPNIVFTGKVAWHNYSALRDMINALNTINETDIKLIFDIYTDTQEDQIVQFLGSVPEFVKIHPPVPNSEIPPILSSASIVFLPISIDDHTKKFTRYSMSTKMGEYLASGTPMIYYGPKGIAMTEFVEERNCSINVTDRERKQLLKALNKCLTGDNVAMLQNAKFIAEKYFKKEVVGKQFKEKILEIL